MFPEKRQSARQLSALTEVGKDIPEHCLSLLQPQNFYSLSQAVQTSWILSRWGHSGHMWQGREGSNGETPLRIKNCFSCSITTFLPPHLHFPVSHLWQLLHSHNWNFPDQKRVHHNFREMQKYKCGCWKHCPLTTETKSNGYKQQCRKLHHLDKKSRQYNVQSRKTRPGWSKLFMSLLHREFCQQDDAFAPFSSPTV